MANIGTLTAEELAQQQQNLRQQKMSEMLLQSGFQQPQGQMVSGRYVAPSLTQNLAGLANIYAGKTGIEKAEKAQLDLAERLRANQSTEAQNIVGALKGTPEQTVYGAGMEGPTMNVTPAVAGSRDKALMEALKGRSQFSQSMAGKLLEQDFKEPKFEKIEQYDPKTGNTMVGMVNVNSPNPEATYRSIGISKPEMSTKDRAELADKGIIVGGGQSSGGMPVAGGQGGGQNNQNYNLSLSPEKNRELNFNKAKLQIEYADKAPAALEMMNQTLTNVNDLIGDTKVVDGKVVYGKKPPLKGFEESVGFSTAPLGKYVAGTDVSNFNVRFNQIKDKSFLQAFELLKGSGQITEIEGAKATSALNRMSLAQSEKEFIVAAREFEENVKKGMELSKQRAGMPTNSGWRVK